MLLRTLLATGLLFLSYASPVAYAENNFDFFFKPSSDYVDVKVEEVRSVDRFVIYSSENKKEIIRMIGLKPSEVPKRKRIKSKRDQYGFVVNDDVSPTSPIEEQAYEFSKSMLLGQRVRLEFDSTKTDDDNNTLAYVYLLDDDVFVNREVLRKGFAQLQVRPPNTKYRKELRAAYQEARRDKLGYHGQ